jgi:hypothetical protein
MQAVKGAGRIWLAAVRAVSDLALTIVAVRTTASKQVDHLQLPVDSILSTIVVMSSFTSQSHALQEWCPLLLANHMHFKKW